MTFPLSPESASVTFRSRISEPILRVCIRDGELTIVKPGVDRNASLKITDFCADGTGDIATGFQLLCNDFDLIVLQKLKVYFPIFQLLAMHVSN